MKKPCTPRALYLRKKRNGKIKVLCLQVAVLAVFLGAWEFLTQVRLVDAFFVSSPSRILIKLGQLFRQDFMPHIGITLLECILGFVISTIAGFLAAVALWWSDTLRRVLDPYIVVLNSLPKIALGPIIIIWVGAGMKSIIMMTFLICIVVTVISMLQSFLACDKNKVFLMQSMGASKLQIFYKLVLPNAVPELISVLKINIGLAWVGTIMGEYIMSSAGLGHLIIYGGQVFQIDLVMASIVVLCVLAGLMYFLIARLEKFFRKRRGGSLQ
ncbi:MAG: ABC transporter permease [Clostridiales bacterium]|jgi:NitT/TauT family transport system permease protein|nr:ABC transporter permease [Clostridiales bacterium]